MPISFNQIPGNLRVPLAYVEFDNSGAIKGTPVMEWRILVVGQKDSTAKGPSLAPTLITSADQAADLWGHGSMIAAMFRAIKRANTFVAYPEWAMHQHGADIPVYRRRARCL
ncbi:MAG: hypothetical protein RRY29_11360 [Desulfovibrionaceae bacterium]